MSNLKKRNNNVSYQKGNSSLINITDCISEKSPTGSYTIEENV